MAETDIEHGGGGLPWRLGAEGVVMDGLDAAPVGEAVAQARPEMLVVGSPQHAIRRKEMEISRFW